MSCRKFPSFVTARSHYPLLLQCTRNRCSALYYKKSVQYTALEISAMYLHYKKSVQYTALEICGCNALYYIALQYCTSLWCTFMNFDALLCTVYAQCNEPSLSCLILCYCNNVTLVACLISCVILQYCVNPVTCLLYCVSVILCYNPT